jgi:hypothetical protein
MRKTNAFKVTWDEATGRPGTGTIKRSVVVVCDTVGQAMLGAAHEAGTFDSQPISGFNAEQIKDLEFLVDDREAIRDALAEAVQNMDTRL